MKKLRYTSSNSFYYKWVKIAFKKVLVKKNILYKKKINFPIALFLAPPAQERGFQLASAKREKFPEPINLKAIYHLKIGKLLKEIQCSYASTIEFLSFIFITIFLSPVRLFLP